MFRLSFVLIVAIPLVSCARAQSPAEEEGRRVVEAYPIELASPALVRQYAGAARRGCGANEGLDFRGYGDCQVVRLTLAERELTAASARHEAMIAEMSRGFPIESSRAAFEERWLAVWAYSQSQWRRSRDADCAESVFVFVGGNGAGTQKLLCMADRTFERAAQLSR